MWGEDMKKYFIVSLFMWLSALQGADNTPFNNCYQDIIVNNMVLKRDMRDYEKRYDALKLILNKYKRPITVLDLGAGHGYFSFRIANDYQSTCVMIEGNDRSSRMGDELLELCHLNSKLQNIVLLKTKISLPDLEKLADCEHFDVVLAFDFINPEDAYAQRITDAILRLGDNIFIESSLSTDPTDQKSISMQKMDGYLQSKKGTTLLSMPCEINQKTQKKLSWFSLHKNGLRCHHFDLESKDSNLDSYRIESTFSHKYLFKKNSAGIAWLRGINLVTFLMLEGAYPTRSQIKQSVFQASKQHLTDFVPWNMIVQGHNIALIDQNDYAWRVHVDKSLQYAFDMIDQQSRQGVLEIFKQYRKRHIRKLK